MNGDKSALLSRFAKLANRGSQRGASSGEKVANKLAKALRTIGDDAALLDPQAIEGACLLLRAMAGPWPTDESKAAVFRVLEAATGGAR